ncbi:MAG: HlyD family efflux transporter periplasmic adaptor subunit [Prolixibacteraceae bacterium]|jgi:hypothetical protein|nr:HlyD family efflux transporter periplasmic adaptor subunit [Prolixibacteraceae bacterium]
MPDENIIEKHSEEVQELMGEIPGRIVQRGIVIIFAILIMLIVGSYFFRYPELIKVPIVITTLQPPVSLVARTSGNLTQIFVNNGDRVQPQMPIALIENTSNYEDVEKLKVLLLQWSVSSDFMLFLKMKLPSFNLGEMQSTYEMFKKSTEKYKLYHSQNYIPIRISILKQQADKQREYFKNILIQNEYKMKDLAISQQDYQRDSLLYNLDLPAIASAEYNHSEQLFLQKKSAYIGFVATVNKAELDILQMNENIVELQMQYEQEILNGEMEVKENMQLLLSQIKLWEENYLIISPIAGIVTFTNYWSQNQFIPSGERMASIVPEGAEFIIGRAIIPSNGFGKVKLGQQVNIKLDGYPYMEFGMLKGKIKSISLVPEESGYMAEVSVDRGMISSYKDQLRFIQEMEGTAEIVTKDMRLIYHFINPLRALIDQNR